MSQYTGEDNPSPEDSPLGAILRILVGLGILIVITIVVYYSITIVIGGFPLILWLIGGAGAIVVAWMLGSMVVK